MKKIITAGLVAAGLLVGGAAAPVQAAPVKAGKVCKTKGKTVVKQGTVYKCKKYGKVRVWVAVRLVKPAPTPRPTGSPEAPTPAETSAPKPSASQTPEAPKPTVTPSPEQTVPPVPVITPTPTPTTPAPETITVTGRGEAYCPWIEYEPVSWKFLPMTRKQLSWFNPSTTVPHADKLVLSGDYEARQFIDWHWFDYAADGTLIGIGFEGKPVERVKYLNLATAQYDGTNTYRAVPENNGYRIMVSLQRSVAKYDRFWNLSYDTWQTIELADPYSDIEVTCQRTDW